ncbi:hypothetical protein [Nocardia pseudobrasiliensis]|uniref:Acid stress chaperone HdeA n=1 Tax=Nocardia pseudobrasiliensis TaxID=45979 RepID=A0A370I489_9NOCA|nr:hypothetical protein [Nocardia pseudobrasiliensis]RDI65563.1 hypothetical protein DFR76_106435 [Nocardia pseudobrasiliensis]
MRFAKAGAFAVALAGALMSGAGVASADQSITVTAQMLDCATKADIKTPDMDKFMSVSPGESVMLSDDTAAELRQRGCLG